MTMTVKIISGDGEGTRTVAAASIDSKPSDRVQIIVDGVVLDPSRLALEIALPDLVVGLPDGGKVTLENFVDLTGQAGGGLVGPDSGLVVVASTLEGLTAPAAGDGGGPDLADENNLSAVNEPTFFQFAEFGTGSGGLGPDLEDLLAVSINDPEAFEVIVAALENAEVIVLPVMSPEEALEADPVIAEAVETPEDAIVLLLGPIVVVVVPPTVAPPPPPPVVGPPEAVDDLAALDENAILLQPLSVNLLDNDLDPGSDGLIVEEILPAGVTFTMPANTMITAEVDKPLAPGELVNKDVTLAQDISLPPFFTLFDDIGRFNLTVREDGTATVNVLDGNPFGAMGSGDRFEIGFGYQLLDGLGETDQADAGLSILGINEAPVAKDVNLVSYADGLGFPIPVFSLTFPTTDEETILENLSLSLADPAQLPADGGFVVETSTTFADTFGSTPTDLDDASVQTGTTTYIITDPEGATATATLTVELRGKELGTDLIGSDDPTVADFLRDNANFPILRDSVLRGRAGDDNLDGGLGNDTLYGGEGVDFAIAGNGNDTTYGDAGNDDLLGFDGVDRVYGGSGDDVVDGGADGDSLFGGLGDDGLFGGDNFDFGTFSFIDQPELFVGGPGSDSLSVSSGTEGAVDRVAWLAGDADGSTDSVSGFDNAGADQDLLDLSAVLVGFVTGVSDLADFLTVTNDGVSTTIEVDTDGPAGGSSVDLTIVLTEIGDGTLANLTDNIVV